MSDIMADLTGGCACGAVRYRLTTAPSETGWCHCRTCQLSSGSPALAFTTVSRENYVIDAGADRIRTRRSSETGTRGFCGDCGTPLTIAVTWQPDTIDVTAATLDTPEAALPEYHIFYAERIGWAPAGDDLPRSDGWRLDTAGREVPS